MIWFIALWISTLGLKIGVSALLPLAPDEAYYWIWSLNPQLSYFDHPGMVAWLFRLGSAFSFVPQGERIPAIILNHSLLLVWAQILRRLWTPDLTRKWMLLVLASPFLGLGSILVTPDSPVLFFMSLSLLCFIQQQATRDWIWSLALGLSLGLGFCSKYHIVLLVFSFLIYVVLEKRWKSIRIADWGLVLVGGFAGALPVLLWNFQNDFASFRFQLNHGLGRSDWQPHWTGDYVLGQLLIFFPSLLFLFVTGYRFRKLRLFFWIAAVPWLFFFVSSFRGAVQGNWPIVGYHAALVLVVATHRSWNHLKGIIVFWLTAEALVVSQWIYPWWSTAPDKLQEVHQLRSHIEELKAYRPLFGGSYQISSILWYYGAEPIYKLRGMSRFDYFDQLPGSTPSRSRFYVFRTRGEPLPEWLNAQRPHVSIVRDFPGQSDESGYELIEVHP